MTIREKVLLDRCRDLTMTLELAWAERQIVAPGFVQCQLGEAAKRARLAIAEIVGSDKPYAEELAERMNRYGARK